jgi:hypothetical protein
MRTHLSLLALIIAIGLSACTPGKNRGGKSDDLSKAGPVQHFTSPGGDFSLAPPASLRRMGHDSVPWSSAIPQTDENGVVAYFFGGAKTIALASPHLRVEYLSRSMDGAGSPEDLFSWLKGLFMGENYGGSLVSEGKTLTTGDGKPVPYLEISIPAKPDPNHPETTRSGKSMIWAYIPLGEDYLLGVNGTAVFPEDYRDLKKAFVTTIQSFRE